MSRKRATAGVIGNNGKVLLVRDKGISRFSLPGGGVNGNEPSISAAAREVFEETGLVVHEIKWVLDYKSSTQRHVVFLARAHGRARIRTELAELCWWDMAEPLKRFDHVSKILDRIKPSAA